MVENSDPMVYAGIIDDLGRRLYSGNVTWLREYIQNAIDSGAPSIEIKLHGNDIEIVDYGKGMDRDSLITEAFSIGTSFKPESEIGELGIGMYAGSGICDNIVVRTKMAEKRVYVAIINMREYREIIAKAPKTTFQEMMGKIFKVEEDRENDPSNSFTQIRFEGVSRDTLTLIEQSNLKEFIEYTVNLPISETFIHKPSLTTFLESASKEITISLDINGVIVQVMKFESGSIAFADTFWAKNITDVDGKIIGKLWATYNKSGASLDDARILVKRKGLTVGDGSTVESQFHAKYSPRFYGEIILLDDRIEINTSRNWFVASGHLSSFVEKTRLLLNELYGIAEFDSKIGVGVINLSRTNARLEARAETNERKKNIGLAVEERDKIQRNEEKIVEKITLAKEFKAKADRGEINVEDPTNKLKLELVNRTLNDPKIKSYIKTVQINDTPNLVKKERRKPWPAIVITFLKENLIDSDLARRIGQGDIKDTTDRAFTFIEQKLKRLLDKEEQQSVDWSDLLSEFKRKYEPPDLKGISLAKYIESFNGIMNGVHIIFRNKSNHSFMDDMNNPRNLLEVILIADFIVLWLDQWKKKEDP